MNANLVIFFSNQTFRIENCVQRFCETYCTRKRVVKFASEDIVVYPVGLRQLKRAGIDCNVLVRFYCSVIRSVLEYACQVFHCSLPNYLSDEIERIQRRALRIIFPNCTYSEGLVRAGLPMLFSRRQSLCQELFHNIVSDSNHKLHQLLPPRASHNRRLRFTRMFDSPICKTNRFRDSFIISHSF